MNRSLRIAVGDNEPRMQDFYREMLPLLGHQLRTLSGSGRELVRQCCRQAHDLLITDVQLADMGGIEAAVAINRVAPLPVLLVSAATDLDCLARAQEIYLLAYLRKPLDPPRLEAALALGLGRFQQFQALQREAAEVGQALEDRKAIERARGLLMTKGNLDDGEALRRLEELARNHNRPLADIARDLLLAEDAFQPRRGRVGRETAGHRREAGRGVRPHISAFQSLPA